jgi:hypothetical protein
VATCLHQGVRTYVFLVRITNTLIEYMYYPGVLSSYELGVLWDTFDDSKHVVTKKC